MQLDIITNFLLGSFHDSILLSAKISNRIESLKVLLGANPAIRCNLFVFKGKTKRIFTSIGAGDFVFRMVLV